MQKAARCGRQPFGSFSVEAERKRKALPATWPQTLDFFRSVYCSARACQQSSSPQRGNSSVDDRKRVSMFRGRLTLSLGRTKQSG